MNIIGSDGQLLMPQISKLICGIRSCPLSTEAFSLFKRVRHQRNPSYPCNPCVAEGDPCLNKPSAVVRDRLRLNTFCFRLRAVSCPLCFPVPHALCLPKFAIHNPLLSSDLWPLTSVSNLRPLSSDLRRPTSDFCLFHSLVGPLIFLVLEGY